MPRNGGHSGPSCRANGGYCSGEKTLSGRAGGQSAPGAHSAHAGRCVQRRLTLWRRGSQVCVVTGASSGIGEAIARALHSGGASVCLGARREDRLAALCSELAGAVFLVTDVTKGADVEALVAKAETSFGKGVDILCNVAGVMYFTMVRAPAHRWPRWTRRARR